MSSAVASALTIQMYPQLQSNLNEETASLLRVRVYETNKITFGGDASIVPQWLRLGFGRRLPCSFADNGSRCQGRID